MSGIGFESRGFDVEVIALLEAVRDECLSVDSSPRLNAAYNRVYSLIHEAHAAPLTVLLGPEDVD